MKVIKRIKRETPQQKIKHFFTEMGVATKVTLILYSVIAIILVLTTEPSRSSLLRFFYMRFTEIFFFVIVGLSDLRREQQKGSFYFILSFFFFKNVLIIIVQTTICSFVENWPTFDVFSQTAVPIQFLFTIMVEDAFRQPESLKYLFIEPFQIKAKFYPIFVFLLLMITSVRVDLVIPFVLALIFYFGKVDTFLLWVSKFLNNKFLNERLLGLGFIKETNKQQKTKNLDQLATNDSIFLEQK